MEVMMMGRGHDRGWKGWFAIPIIKISSLEAPTCNIPILWFWVVKRQWVGPCIGESGRDQNSANLYKVHFFIRPTCSLISWVTAIVGRIWDW